MPNPSVTVTLPASIPDLPVRLKGNPDTPIAATLATPQGQQIAARVDVLTPKPVEASLTGTLAATVDVGTQGGKPIAAAISGGDPTNPIVARIDPISASVGGTGVPLQLAVLPPRTRIKFQLFGWSWATLFSIEIGPTQP